MTSDSVAVGCSQRRRVAIYARVSTTEQHTEPQAGRLHRNGRSVPEIAELPAVGKSIVHREVARLRTLDPA